MKSRWYELKPAALLLRRNGQSLRFIEMNLGVPRSTLSGWLKDAPLSKAQQSKLAEARLAGLSKARAVATTRHHELKLARLKEAEVSARRTLASITLTPDLLELALAMLYWGEGKKSQTTSIGSSDASMLKFFLFVLTSNYGLKPRDVTCELHLRQDQHSLKEVTYWSKALNIPTANFKRVYFDKRTRGKATYNHYHGVCLLKCSNVAIQRKLVYLYKLFSEEITGLGD